MGVSVGSAGVPRPVCPHHVFFCRLTRLLTSPALPRKQRASLEVTSERCVVMPRCCACATLCTRRETGTGLTHPSVCPASGCGLSSPVWLSVHLSQAIGGSGALHHSVRPPEINHEDEEVKVGGRSRCSAARRPGLTPGHMTSPPGRWDVDGAVVTSHRCRLSTSLPSGPERTELSSPS